MTIMNTGIEVINTANMTKTAKPWSTIVKLNDLNKYSPIGKAYTDMSAITLGRRSEMTERIVEFGGVFKALAPVKPITRYIAQEMEREIQITRRMSVEGWTLLTNAGIVVT